MSNVKAWPMICGLMYGGITAGAYLALKVVGSTSGLALFCAASLILFITHFLIWPGIMLEAVALKQNIIRGLLWGTAQSCFFYAQQNGTTSSMFIAALTGSIVGSVLGRIYLKESPTRLDYFSAALCITGVFLDSEAGLTNLWAIGGGLIQGLTALTARSMMKKKVSLRGAVGSGFLLCFLVSFVFLVIVGQVGDLGHLVRWKLIAAILIVVSVQYAYFVMMKTLDIQAASIVSLSRMPWALLFEWSILGMAMSSGKILSGALIMLASLITLSHKRPATAPLSASPAASPAVSPE